MTLQINMNPAAAVQGGAGIGLMTSAGNPWAVPDALAQELVNRGVATAVSWPSNSAQPLTSDEILALRTVVFKYQRQSAVWYAGDINSVTTPSIMADGDLATATDQVPLKWLVVVDADDDVSAAQALLDGGPNVITVVPGGQPEYKSNVDASGLPKTFTRIYAICKSSSAIPADYTGGAYIASGSETGASGLAVVLANMARFDFSAGLSVTEAQLIASSVYSTYYTQLAVSAGVLS